MGKLEVNYFVLCNVYCFEKVFVYVMLFDMNLYME